MGDYFWYVFGFFRFGVFYVEGVDFVDGFEFFFFDSYFFEFDEVNE